MRAIETAQLRPGLKLRTPLLHRSGITLVESGQVLDRRVLQAFRRRGVDQVFVPEEHERVEDVCRALTLKPVAVSKLKVGERLERPIYDQEGTLLLESGATIPGTFSQSLARRGIHEIFYRLPEGTLQTRQGRDLTEELHELLDAGKSITSEIQLLESIELATARDQDLHEDSLRASIDTAESLEVVPEGEALEEELRIDQKMAMQSEEEKSAFLELYQEALRGVRSLFRRLSSGGRVDGNLVRRIAEQTVAGLIRNRELLMAAGMLSLPGNYLISHAVAVATLAVNIGSALGYSKAQVLALGHGALLHDVGMLRLPPSVLNKPSKLTKREWQEIRRHPAYGLDMLQKIVGIPEEVPFIVYQSHERLDGSGYPRGKKGQVIHTFAKIVAVADIYNSICSERPYREALSPYEAMERLVLLCGERKLDSRIVRAFLRCNSMFPVGSWVELSNQCRGRVVAANDEDYMRPVVSVLFDESGGRLRRPERHNLLDEKPLTITQALSDDEVGQVACMEGF
jgi:HD-GYP domain-containing protein (c-di-GMP phosphodiesterase class II)